MNRTYVYQSRRQVGDEDRGSSLREVIFERKAIVSAPDMVESVPVALFIANAFPKAAIVVFTSDPSCCLMAVAPFWYVEFKPAVEVTAEEESFAEAVYDEFMLAETPLRSDAGATLKVELDAEVVEFDPEALSVALERAVPKLGAGAEKAVVVEDMTELEGLAEARAEDEA